MPERTNRKRVVLAGAAVALVIALVVAVWAVYLEGQDEAPATDGPTHALPSP